MKKVELQVPVLECPKCNAFGNYSSGGFVEVATGNFTPYEYRCRECGHTWGKNPYYREPKNEAKTEDARL